MNFPIWRYLNQPLWDSTRPLVLNPWEYWYRHRVGYLNRCVDNVFLEQCWNVSYPDFVVRYNDVCDRNALEENPVWLLERCWHLTRQSLYTFHPDEDCVETDYPENHSSETDPS